MWYAQREVGGTIANRLPTLTTVSRKRHVNRVAGTGIDRESGVRVVVFLALIAIAVSFTLSASAGLGGSLILVPVLSLLFGTKQGVAMSAVLLACNNVGKIVAYRHTLPLKVTAAVVLLTMLGAFLGATLLVHVADVWVKIAVVASITSVFLFERRKRMHAPRAVVPFFALSAGATSGFSGTSGPLKGIALRSLGLDRLHFVGAASLVSVAGDAVKSAVFARASLFDETSWVIFSLALPIIPLSALIGRRINQSIGERVYAGLFWVVMTGYTIRLLAH